MTNEIFGYSLDGETYHGRYATRDEAVEEAIRANSESLYLPPSGEFTTGRHDDPAHASEFVPDIDDILDHMANKASDDYDAEDWPDLGPNDALEAQARLKASLDEFAEAIQLCSPPTFHYIVDEQTHTMPGA